MLLCGFWGPAGLSDAQVWRFLQMGGAWGSHSTALPGPAETAKLTEDGCRPEQDMWGGQLPGSHPGQATGWWEQHWPAPGQELSGQPNHPLGILSPQTPGHASVELESPSGRESPTVAELVPTPSHKAGKSPCVPGGPYPQCRLVASPVLTLSLTGCHLHSRAFAPTGGSGALLA